MTMCMLQVPLGERFNQVLPEHKRFTPRTLVEQLAQRGIQVLHC